MDRISFEQIPDLFERVSTTFAEKKEELCAMDAKLGDGDLGLTMSRGFSALPDLMRELTLEVDGDIGKLLMKAGMKMSSLVPSTMGFLMSSGIMEGGRALKGCTIFDGRALASYLIGFASGIQKRGKCELGQRTIFDALKPAADAANSCVCTNPAADLQAIINAAVTAGKEGVEATKNMVPVFGKAAVHAAQSVGVADQGATAGYYMLLGMQEYIC